MSRVNWRGGVCAALFVGAAWCGSSASAQVLEVTPPPPPAPGESGVDTRGPANSDEQAIGSPLLPQSVPPVQTGPPSPFPYSMYAEHPHAGDPAAPSVGHPHYDAPFWHYGHWFRPRAATLTADQRCRCPDRFRPRGFGNLFARPCDPYRLEYDPYVIDDERNDYGPSYFWRQPDQFCRDHHPRRR